MEVVNSIIGFITKLVQWWFVVNPWEQAIRVRKGNQVRVLNAGLYLKVPFIDHVYIQTTRMRTVETAMQTITAADGTTITIKLCIGYVIRDILTLYKSLYHPETTLSNMAIGITSQYIRGKRISEIAPGMLEESIQNEIEKIDYGLSNFTVNITTFAIVRTYRIIQDSSSGSRYDDLVMTAIK